MGDGSNTAAGAYSNSFDSSYVPPGASTRLTGPANAAASSTGNYAGTGATAIGGVTSAWASMESGRRNNQIAKANARIARQQAAQAEQAGHFAANRVAIKAQQAEHSAIASAAGSGVVAGAGSSGISRHATEAAAASDRMLIELNARRQAYGYQSRAAADTFQGEMAQQQGNLQAAETLLNTGSKLWQQSDRSHQSGLEFT